MSNAFDATDLEVARREHDAEMGATDVIEPKWLRWYESAKMSVVSNGWETPLTRGLDGAEDEDGFSLDYAYEAFERGESVATYIAKVSAKRERMGL